MSIILSLKQWMLPLPSQMPVGPTTPCRVWCSVPTGLLKSSRRIRLSLYLHCPSHYRTCISSHLYIGHRNCIDAENDWYVYCLTEAVPVRGSTSVIKWLSTVLSNRFCLKASSYRALLNIAVCKLYILQVILCALSDCQLMRVHSTCKSSMVPSRFKCLGNYTRWNVLREICNAAYSLNF